MLELLRNHPKMGDTNQVEQAVARFDADAAVRKVHTLSQHCKHVLPSLAVKFGRLGYFSRRIRILLHLTGVKEGFLAENAVTPDFSLMIDSSPVHT